MNYKKLIGFALIFLTLSGCASTRENVFVLKEADFSGNKPYTVDESTKSVVCKDGKCKSNLAQSLKFPKDGLLGLATSSQAKALANMVEASHNTLMNRLDTLSETQDKRHRDIIKRVDAIEESLNTRIAGLESSIQKRIIDSSADIRLSVGREIKSVLSAMDDINKKHSQGEITVFFQSKSRLLSAAEQKRLTAFLDNMFKGYNGGNVLFAIKGSASSGSKFENERLVRAREKTVEDAISRHLVNVPYEFINIDEMGVKRENFAKKGGQYQNVRVIAAIHGDINEILKLLQETELRQIALKPPKPEAIKPIKPVKDAAIKPQAQPEPTKIPNQGLPSQPPVKAPMQQGKPEQQQEQGSQQFNLPTNRSMERGDKDINSLIKEGLQQFPPAKQNK